MKSDLYSEILEYEKITKSIDDFVEKISEDSKTRDDFLEKYIKEFINSDQNNINEIVQNCANSFPYVLQGFGVSV